MELIYPKYFDEFRCLASDCPDSCCKDWDLLVDEASAGRYRGLPGPLGDSLRSVLHDVDGDTIMAKAADGRCPMWRDDGLCRIQAELGEDALCQVCRDFPRLRHDYGDFVELGLELSCPEAARLILASPAQDMITRQLSGADAAEYDREAMSLLRSTRAVALKILEDPAFDTGEALAVLLLYGYGVQEALDGGELEDFSPADALVEARSLAQLGKMEPLFTLYQDLEILTDSWRDLLAAGPAEAPWEDRHRALARYFLERYWLQAVSDYDLTSRVKFIIVSCLMIRSLGGNISETAQLYSKEIENDADNVDALLDAAYSSPALTDVTLLGLLLK